eukprot:s4298_g3.t1
MASCLQVFISQPIPAPCLTPRRWPECAQGKRFLSLRWIYMTFAPWLAAWHPLPLLTQVRVGTWKAFNQLRSAIAAAGHTSAAKAMDGEPAEAEAVPEAEVAPAEGAAPAEAAPAAEAAEAPVDAAEAPVEGAPDAAPAEADIQVWVGWFLKLLALGI